MRDLLCDLAHGVMALSALPVAAGLLGDIPTLTDTGLASFALGAVVALVTHRPWRWRP